MRDIEKVKEIFRRYGGMMRTYQLFDEKIYYADIAYLLNEGFIEKVRTGYYQWLDNDNMSEAALSPAFFPDGILCMDTALRHYGYSDRTPAEWHIAVNKYSNRTRFQIDYPFVKPYYVAPELLKLGLCEQIIDGNAVKMYDKERIISYDILFCFLRTGSREEAVLSSQDPRHVQYSQKNQCKTNILVQTADNTKKYFTTLAK